MFTQELFLESGDVLTYFIPKNTGNYILNEKEGRVTVHSKATKNSYPVFEIHKKNGKYCIYPTNKTFAKLYKPCTSGVQQITRKWTTQVDLVYARFLIYVNDDIKDTEKFVIWIMRVL